MPSSQLTEQAAVVSIGNAIVVSNLILIKNNAPPPHPWTHKHDIRNDFIEMEIV